MDKDSISGSGMYGWHRLMKTAFGWSPTVDFLPAIPAAIALYLSLYFFGLVLYHCTELIVPKSIRGYVHDFIKTLIIVAYPFGHGILRKYHGEVGYMCGMVPVLFITTSTLKEGDGNPIAVWLQYFRRTIPLWKCLLKNFIQIVAGISAYHLGMYILGLELHPAYVERLKSYYNQFCDTDLHVTEYAGFLIECVAVVYDSWFWAQTFTRSPALDRLLKIINGGLLVVAGVHLTGMYLHPAMASGHTWGCGDTSKLTHVAIYWVGPMIGTWISIQIQKKISIGKPVTETPRSRTQNEGKRSKNETKKSQNGNTQGQGQKQANGTPRRRQYY
ncbi:uncharacterized protein LOC127855000 [Dreissena polymorpha]|uniref:Uncharacterized protein n=1 Tax=Dreissena polymorpha TaxID=45954 RepID=A0A9D4C928_DREPO|nr:uncharacterized protein LOC127855000 [Dreissena polymorpha]XP_052246201.1 uncharacterized protein LOC127855000 [Dreissena polymorpha]XP_052246202.1 uncharacterized protein LOC127855000 [Dreissena polymorpha]XP_052246203.1 uncharacterized protein LOC127855000 [Dreissena polymorpha]XP_052246204.1 uncharacterized protein LOC127855000 [Dreissena polymorpha]XP_052246205.1 uncharacterized protein LOC127855000 [Dreissena polymorpha]XP_052246206.1 uncharacterized protein LOC127855000 [Dreissena po